MSKRKIPLRSDIKRMPNWPGEHIFPQTPQSQGKSSGSTLPYVSGNKEGFGNNPSLADAFGNFAGRTDWLSEALGSTNPSNLSSQLLQFLLAMNAKNLSAERIDALFQLILQSAGVNDQRAFDEYLKEDQRNYDWALKQEQRVYDNPQNQLARLMGAGISRDAALQMLSGSAGNIGGAGASSVPYGSGTGISAPSVSAPSGTQSLNIANTAMNGAQTLASLVQSGVGIAAGIEQVKMMQAQNYMTKQESLSYDATKQVTQQIEIMKESGILDDETIGSWTNLHDMQRWLDDHADTNGVAPLIQSGALRGSFGTPFGRKHLQDYFSNVIKGRSEGDQISEFLRQQRLNNAILAIEPARIGSEMALMGKEGDKIEQDILESCNRIAVGDADIKLKNKQGQFVDVQKKQLVRQTDSNINLQDTEAYVLDIQGRGYSIANDQAALDYEYNSAGFPMLKQIRIDEITNELKKWQLYMSPDLLQQRQLQWLHEHNNAYHAAYLKEIYYRGAGDFAVSHPVLWNLCSGLSATGVYDLVSSGSQAGVAGATIYKAIK